MTCIRKAAFLLSLLLHEVCCEEPEPVFRPVGGIIEMGYCFTMDYMVVYRSAPEGDQLLGNSSADNSPVTPPVDFQGRIRTYNFNHMLGLSISRLTHMDSGVYRKECWNNGSLHSKRINHLYVCDERTESEGVVVKKDDGNAEILCNSTFTGLEGTSVRWYYDSHLSYKQTLIVDSGASLEPLVPELRGAVEVGLDGALLSVVGSVLQQSYQFVCVVIKNGKCLSFQNIDLPENGAVQVFASQGDRLVLNCTTGDKNQQWDTPLGQINISTSPNRAMKMRISRSEGSESYSLVISAVSEMHGGAYVCVSPSAEVEYHLVLCPKKEHKEKVASVGENVSLHCDVGQEELQVVQWHRQETSTGYGLIYNSYDDTVPIPEDLKGRVSVSDNGSTLTLSNVILKDLRKYWCVVLGQPDFLDYDEDYSDEDEEGEVEEEVEKEEDPTEEGDYSSHDTFKCIFKQEINVLAKTGREVENATVRVLQDATGVSVVETETPVEAETPVATYAVAGGLGGLVLLAGVIAAVIVIKKRTRAEAAPSASQDIKMNEDPECTEMLRHNDESNG